MKNKSLEDRLFYSKLNKKNKVDLATGKYMSFEASPYGNISVVISLEKGSKPFQCFWNLKQALELSIELNKEVKKCYKVLETDYKITSKDAFGWEEKYFKLKEGLSFRNQRASSPIEKKEKKRNG